MHSLHFRQLLVLLVACLGLSTRAIAATIFVDTDASGANNGTSWDDAFTDLQAALQAAQFDDEIWVAAGIYIPTKDQWPEASFRLRPGVRLFGGFAGGESTLYERDWVAHPSVLSGKLPYEAEAYHVVVADGVGMDTILDGFTIQDGRVPWGRSGPGSGILLLASSPVIRNCTIRNNYNSDAGGGIANLGGGSPTFVNIDVRGNGAETGGGLYNDGGIVTVRRASFSNRSDGAGGDIRNVNGGVCDFTDVDLNGFAHGSGGAVSNRESTLKFDQVRIDGSSEQRCGGIANFGKCELELSRVRFEGCWSDTSPAGLYFEAGIAKLVDVEFRNCFTGTSNELTLGAAIYNVQGTLLLNRSTFVRNRVGGRGGAIANAAGSVTAMNCQFLDNVARLGGAIYNSGTQFELINSTFQGNILLESGANSVLAAFSRGTSVFNSTSMSIANCLFWGDESSSGEAAIQDNGVALVTHSLISGSGGSGATWNSAFGRDGGGNLDADPLYADIEAGDLQLRSGSPAIDAGELAFLPPGTLLDAAAQPRVVGASIDMGAFEYQGSVSAYGASWSELKRRFGF